MKTENELFKLIKDNYSLNPRKEFVSATDNRLRQIARKLDRKRKYKRFSFVTAGIALCLMALSWMFLLGGHEVINVAISAAGQNKLVPAATQQKPLIYIYHTHNRESFIPEINVKEGVESLDESKNITLVGKRLKDSLIEKNIATIHDSSDFMGILKERGLAPNKIYEVSRESLDNTLKKNSSIKMVIDIHRDSIARRDSTFIINEKEYAKIALIVSRASNNYEENVKLAELIHNKMEKKYPGISRGVIVKDNKRQSTYNMDILGNSVLMNIGGVDNTLEEEYRTAELLATIIKDIIKTN
jgi:stage II sporulation protein P